MTSIDPNDYIITRKRKKYRFALFAGAPNCFELDAWQSLVDKPSVDVVEVGAGTALFLVELASRYPDQNFVALDVKADRLQKGARQAIERGLTNIYFVRARADQLLEVVPLRSLRTVWLTFSDPFPRDSDAKRRLTAPSFLTLYERALLQGGTLQQKTDSRLLFDWSLEQLALRGWHIGEVVYDLHASGVPDDCKILTTYEQKWLSHDLPIYYLSATSPKVLSKNDRSAKN